MLHNDTCNLRHLTETDPSPHITGNTNRSKMQKNMGRKVEKLDGK